MGDHPQRRHTDGHHRLRAAGRALVRVVGGDRRPAENRYRDFLIVFALGLMVWALSLVLTAQHTADRATQTAGRATRDASTALVQVQAGRQTGIALTCAVLSGVAQAGEAVISGPANRPETPFDAALERLGYPARPQRIRAARQAGQAYINTLLAQVRSALRLRGNGTNPRSLVHPDGSIDCNTFMVLSNVPSR